MIKQGYIHEYGQGRMEPEHRDVLNVLKSRNIPVKLFTSKLLDRRRLDLNLETLVVGEHPIIRKALRYLGIEDLKTNCYPMSIRKFLKRKIWVSKIGPIIDSLYRDELGTGVFVKPKESTKEFTGFVLKSYEDQYMFEGTSKQTQIWCSEVVDIVSEYRVFVNRSQIVGVKNYSGSAEILPNYGFIDDCVKTFNKSEDRTAGYGIDFGIDGKGETFLIEWNDGYSLGSYGLEPDL